MASLVWNADERPYFSGVDHGVLYLPGLPGLAWNGLVSVDEKTDDVVDLDRYIDGVRYHLPQSNEEFGCKVSAYTYPDEFLPYSGYDDIYDGQVNDAVFGFSYKTQSGDKDYIHIVYNATAVPSDTDRTTQNESTEPLLFVWDISTIPSAFNGITPTSHFIIDPSIMRSAALDALLGTLYGTATTDPQLPNIQGLFDVFYDNAIFLVVDNGNGTWTATGPDSAITMTDTTTFSITWPTAVYISSDTYELSTDY